MAEKFNLIIVQNAPEEPEEPKEPEIKQCCGTCWKWKPVYNCGDLKSISNVCIDGQESENRLVFTTRDSNINCAAWEEPMSNPDVQDVEVRLRKDNMGKVRTEFRLLSKGEDRWWWGSSIKPSGIIVKEDQNIANYLK